MYNAAVSATADDAHTFRGRQIFIIEEAKSLKAKKATQTRLWILLRRAWAQFQTQGFFVRNRNDKKNKTTKRHDNKSGAPVGWRYIKNGVSNVAIFSDFISKCFRT